MPSKVGDNLDGVGMGRTFLHVREINQREQEIGVPRNMELWQRQRKVRYLKQSRMCHLRITIVMMICLPHCPSP